MDYHFRWPCRSPCKGDWCWLVCPLWSAQVLSMSVWWWGCEHLWLEGLLASVGLQSKKNSMKLWLTVRTQRQLLVEERGRRIGDCTRLPPMWPGFKSQRRSHMWVEFVVGYLPWFQRFFSRVLRFSPLLKNQHFQIPVRLRFNEFIKTLTCFVGKQITKKELIFSTI